ncbi:hypothetical protein H4582DRAFT_1982937 [Lactarius indigo]|nr:hypothetical protein H4582DRAFT_1982937 [Lactarius indigo]
MLFYKPLVSLVTAMALAGTVTASATPVRRNDPRCQAQNQDFYCCTEGGPLSTLSAPVKALGVLLGLDVNAIVAVDCVIDVLCGDGTAACCSDDPEQYGLINISLGCTIL